MKPTTAWGNRLLDRSWWDEGMRGHFIRLSNTTGPGDMEFAIRAIEDEARALPPDPEWLRAFFAARGWDIHMDDRPGQPVDPFAAIIAAWPSDD